MNVRSWVLRHAHRPLAILVVSALATVGAVAGGTTVTAYTTVTYNGAGSAAHIGLIGDSSLAGVRWANSYAPLQRFNYTFDAESCRRTATPSCSGREGYAPQHGLDTLRRLRGQMGSVLVMVTGYNDPGTSFASSVDAIMTEARAQGISKVIWLTMRTADVSYVAPTFQSSTYTFRDNNRILLQKSQQYGGQLQIADWATYSATQLSWVTSDGVHLTTSGAWAIAAFIAEQTARVLAGETITPPAPTTPIDDGWVTVRRGDRGTLVTIVQKALIRNGISVYGGADGIFGAYTEAAVIRFQTSRGLPAHGIADVATAQALGVYGGTTETPPPPPISWTNLVIGSRGTMVAAAQRAVMNSGIYLRGGADGIYGSYTSAAVGVYQSRRALAVTGIVDVATAQAMGLVSGGTAAPSTPTVTSWTTLSVGSRGTMVAAAQRAVISADIYLLGGADGVYGTYTQAAVRTYQTRRGLAVTGAVDLATAQAMGLIAIAPPATTTTTVPATVETTTTTAAPTTIEAATETTTEATDPTSTSSSTTAVSTTSVPVADAPAAAVTSSVTGVAWTDTNADGQRDSGEAPIPDLPVRVLDAGEMTVLATTVTGLDGTYEVALPARTAAVVVEFWIDPGQTITLTDQGNDLTDSDLRSMTTAVNGSWARSAPVSPGVDPISVDGGLVPA